MALLRSESVPDKVLLVGEFETDELAREAAGMAMLVANSESEWEWIALVGVVDAEE